MKHSPVPSCSRATTSATDSKKKSSSLNNRTSESRSFSTTSTTTSIFSTFRLLPSHSSFLCLIVILIASLLTAPVATALPIQSLTNSDLIIPVSSNAEVFQANSNIPMEGVKIPTIESAASTKRHTRRSLRRILRYVFYPFCFLLSSLPFLPSSNIGVSFYHFINTHSFRGWV